MSGSQSIFSGTVLSTPLRRAGAASLSIDGDVFDIKASGYDAVPVKREEIDAQNAFAGYSEMPKATRITATIIDAATLTVAGMMQKQNSTLVLTLANGKTVYGDNMACLECSAVNTVEATFEVVFVSNSVTESPL